MPENQSTHDKLNQVPGSLYLTNHNKNKKIEYDVRNEQVSFEWFI